MHVEAPISTVPDSGTPMLHCYRSLQMNKNDSGPVEKLDRAMIFLPSLPTKKRVVQYCSFHQRWICIDWECGNGKGETNNRAH
ncbi:hypothetical protein ACFX13_014657 [Malus domestica]